MGHIWQFGHDIASSSLSVTTSKRCAVLQHEFEEFSEDSEVSAGARSMNLCIGSR